MEDIDEMLDYNGENTHELLALEKHCSLTSLLDLFYTAIDQKAFKLGEESIGEAEMTITSVLEFRSEVRNGGIAQFLRNASGRYAGIIVSSLNRIGCQRSAAIVQKALNKAGNYKAVSSSKLQTLLEPCTEEYFSLGEDLNSALLGFIREHKEQIVLV